MTIFVDASALIAMIADEPDGKALAIRLQAARVRLYSPLSLWETMAGLRKRYGLSVAAAREDVGRYVAAGELTVSGIGMTEYEIAADAFARFGKGRHPAGLNMGDCFAYACARANRARLLFKGDDFPRTDIEPA